MFKTYFVVMQVQEAIVGIKTYAKTFPTGIKLTFITG